MAMQLPSMVNRDNIRKTVQTVFGGYNHTNACAEGELYDMTNMSSDEYPLLSPRRPRVLVQTLEKPNGLFAKDGLLLVDGTDLYYQGVLRGYVADSRKTFAAMGGRIIILPDKMMLNTTYERMGVYADLAALQAGITSPAKYDAYGVGGGVPYRIYVWDGSAWVDNGLELDNLEKTWAGGSLTFRDGEIYGEDAEANTIYAEDVNWADYFRVGDAVAISGCTVHPDNNKTPIIREIDGANLRFSELSFTLGSGTTYTESGALKVARTIPDLDYICECKNRLWGCKDNTVYASKLGDPFNWNAFEGLATDSFFVDVGSAGKFTGCIGYQGYPLFFKENMLHEVYGSKPSNFQVQDTGDLGVAEGSSRSLAIAGEVLYYLSRAGMMAYSGGLPAQIGQGFGPARFHGAVAGSDGLKYYVSMADITSRHLFAFDTAKGIWHREDGLQVLDFGYVGRNLYALSADGKLWALGRPVDVAGTAETSVESLAEFGDFYNSSPDKKGVVKLQFRIDMEAGASIRLFINYDGGAWLPVRTLTATEKRSYYLPVPLKRVDHYRLKIEGTGMYQIYSLAREVSAGSAL